MSSHSCFYSCKSLRFDLVRVDCLSLRLFYCAVYYLLHARCATVAQFDSVPIEDFSQFVARWETFVNEVDERSSYMC